MQTQAKGASLGADTYQVRAVVCPKCRERIEVAKVRNRSAIHAARMRALAAHVNERHVG